jgi:hypothetical protein
MLNIKQKRKEKSIEVENDFQTNSDHFKEGTDSHDLSIEDDLTLMDQTSNSPKNGKNGLEESSKRIKKWTIDEVWILLNY